MEEIFSTYIQPYSTHIIIVLLIVSIIIFLTRGAKKLFQKQLESIALMADQDPENFYTAFISEKANNKEFIRKEISNFTKIKKIKNSKSEGTNLRFELTVETKDGTIKNYQVLAETGPGMVRKIIQLNSF